MIFQGATVADVMNAMQNGIVSETGNQILDDLLTRGGYQSMMWTISLMEPFKMPGGRRNTYFTACSREKKVNYSTAIPWRIHPPGYIYASQWLYSLYLLNI